MLLTDAVHAIETVGGVWLGISAVAFILLGLFVEICRKSAAVDVDARRDGLAKLRDPSTHSRQLDLVAKAGKRPAAKKSSSAQSRLNCRGWRPPNGGEPGLALPARCASPGHAERL